MLNIKFSGIKFKIRKMFLPLIPIYHFIRKMLFGRVNSKKIRSSSEFVKNLQNIHEGKRCFIIGNGPSLNVKDLNLLKNDLCFGCNKIFTLFKETEWRPTYYCISDSKVLNKNYNEIVNLSLDYIFMAVSEIVRYHKVPNLNNVYYIKQIIKDFYPELPNYSEDITKGVYAGNTVIYFALQIAVYMGFKEIYLIGIDHNYSVNLNPDGTIERNENVKDHFSQSDVLVGIPRLQHTTLAYQAAKKYADEHGIKIYNATRGGKLEVFDRVDFDSLFPNVGN